MKIALIQLNIGYDKQSNVAHACDLIYQAAKDSIDIAVLPEMFCCPYEHSYFRPFSESDGGYAQIQLARLARELQIYIVGGSIPEEDGGKLYNTSYVFDPQGSCIAKHRKAHLFDVDVPGGQRFFESNDFCAGNSITTFETKFGTMGLCVCFDFRFQDLARILARRGAKVIFAPSAFNMTTGPAHWEILFRQRAVDNQIFTVGVAPARNINSSYVSYGNSIAVSPWGDVLARCDEKEQVKIVELDLNRIDLVRAQIPILNARRIDLYGE